jgi:chromosome segregation ATPase
MRRNEAAARSIPQYQSDETLMEARIARIESDVGHIRETLTAQAESINELRGEMKAANKSIAGLDGKIASLEGKLDGKIASLEGKLDGRIASLESKLEGKIDTLREQTKALINGLETRMMRWIITTMIAMTTLAFAVAKFVH